MVEETNDDEKVFTCAKCNCKFKLEISLQQKYANWTRLSKSSRKRLSFD